MTEEPVQAQNDTNHDRSIKARSIVYGYIKSQSDTDPNLSFSDVQVVWFCKTLQNWKAMIAVLTPGGSFCEVTYNGDKKETYLDVYRKIENVRLPDE